MMFGNDLGEMLMQMRASCLKCGRVMTFQDGATLAKNNGISDQVVMCGKCSSVYTISINPGGMTLLADVTDKYKKG